MPPTQHKSPLQDPPLFRADEFGILPAMRPSSDDVVRPSYSLPSFQTWSRRPTKPSTTHRKGTRHRSKSTVAGKSNNARPEIAIRGAVRHSRTSSKTSTLVSTRRSSAEFSARQASSRNDDGCWEVDVSKAIINLSLRDHDRNERIRASASTLTANTADAFLGTPCGVNRTPRARVLTLGSPFFLQNPLPRNFINNRVLFNASEENKARDLMEVGETGQIVTTTITAICTDPPPPSTQATRQSSSESAGSSKSGGSRRRERRTRTLSSPRKVDPSETHAFASIQSSLQVPHLSITRPTPEPSPITPVFSFPTRRSHHKSTPTMPPKTLPPVIEKAHSTGSVKRKADEADFLEGDKTPPKETKETKAAVAPDPKTQRLSGSSLLAHAPSSYNRSKRVRLTNSSEGGRSQRTPEGSPPPTAKNTGSWSSRGSHGRRSASSYIHNQREGPPPARSASRASRHAHREPSRRSLSQLSIPISALVSPHAPSITRNGTFHMRDPRKPAPVHNTPWSLSFPTHWERGQSRWEPHSWVARGGSPLHAWFFFIGFMFFPLWWAASFIPTPKTRQLGGTDAEKGVMLDDPQVEHDAKSWRFRCRVMAIVSLVTYVPFIALIIVFTRR